MWYCVLLRSFSLCIRLNELLHNSRKLDDSIYSLLQCPSGRGGASLVLSGTNRREGLLMGRQMWEGEEEKIGGNHDL